MKNLVVCCDGTWNTPKQDKYDLPAPTNVAQFYNCLADRSQDNKTKAINQLSYYHPGVGTDGNRLQRFLGGAFGLGLDDNIKSAYHWLCTHYEPGDHICLIGFSRGAYTVRSLAGLIATCGILRFDSEVREKRQWKSIALAYDKGYRGRKNNWFKKLKKGIKHYQEGPCEGVDIHFVGVWDTVGALGVPDSIGIGAFMKKIRVYKTLKKMKVFDAVEKMSFGGLKYLTPRMFRNQNLSGRVRFARHALAIDEVRASFTPTLWEKSEKESNVVEKWFPGVHADVGGGYTVSGLSDIALRWMIDQAECPEIGVQFDHRMTEQIKPSSRGVLHDSYRGMFKYLRTQPRAIPYIGEGEDGLDYSAYQRKIMPPIKQADYHTPPRLSKPGDQIELTVYAREHWGTAGAYLDPGHYSFVPSGEWLRPYGVCAGPSGPATDISSWRRAAWRSYTKVTRARLGRRRHPELDPYSLVAAIAHKTGQPSVDGVPEPFTHFSLAREVVFEVEKPGYLFAYINDFWRSYKRNRGSLRLTVTRIATPKIEIQ